MFPLAVHVNTEGLFLSRIPTTPYDACHLKSHQHLPGSYSPLRSLFSNAIRVLDSRKIRISATKSLFLRSNCFRSKPPMDSKMAATRSLEMPKSRQHLSHLSSSRRVSSPIHCSTALLILRSLFLAVYDLLASLAAMLLRTFACISCQIAADVPLLSPPQR